MILTETVLAWTALVITALALAVGGTTMAASLWYHYSARRRESRRERLQPELFERLFSADEPEWTAWVGTLSRGERRQLRVLLDEYLRKLRGTEYHQLCSLGAALDLQTQARRDLETDGKRFRALTWLALLSEPVDPAKLEACCTDSPQLRAGAARVLYEGDHPDASRAGTELLVGGGSLTAFGLDTLYRLNNGRSTPLLSMLQEGTEAWSERLLVQVLIALRYCSIETPKGRLEWLPELLEHDSPRVRAAAVGVLERHGWREQFQVRIDIEALLTDPEPTVRRDTYLLLASWNTERSAAWLRWAVTTAKADELALARAYAAHTRIDLSELPADLEPFASWVRADAAVGRRRNVWGVSAAWA
jgi:hypothetical protein